MAYKANPFLERMSEKTSDQEFARLFSPKILDRLEQETLGSGVTIFTSPPGGGKTTLLRAFTPLALRAFWNARLAPEIEESCARLVTIGVMDESTGPQLLGVSLSCASGYADLPPGASAANDGLFRALLDCRIVLRSLRSLASLLGFASIEQIGDVRVHYDPSATEFRAIPRFDTVAELSDWAEHRERIVYDELDSPTSAPSATLPRDVRLEGVLWLQSVRFTLAGKAVAPRRLLMIDDVQKLRRRQRELLVEELVEIRPAMPIWLAERSIALGNELLAQGSRSGRDLRVVALEELWKAGGTQFSTFAQSILDRRLEIQRSIPAGAFSQYLEDQLSAQDLEAPFTAAIARFNEELAPHRGNVRYAEWFARADQQTGAPSFDTLIDLYVTRILVSRIESRRQLSLDLAPLPADELDSTDTKVIGAAAILCHEEVGVPYYFGIDRLCALATSNVEELLNIAAHLYDGMLAVQVIRKRPEPRLSAGEQERRIRDAARQKRSFIPKNHSEGTRAQSLIDAIGAYCRERTFQPNAPYAPGVTGVRLTQFELNLIKDAEPRSGRQHLALLARVLAECVAENLLTVRPIQSSAGRDAGTAFYLNRTLCAAYNLPLGYGGWQDVTAATLIGWMDRGPSGSLGRSLTEMQR